MANYVQRHSYEGAQVLALPMHPLDSIIQQGVELSNSLTGAVRESISSVPLTIDKLVTGAEKLYSRGRDYVTQTLPDQVREGIVYARKKKEKKSHGDKYEGKRPRQGAQEESTGDASSAFLAGFGTPGENNETPGEKKQRLRKERSDRRRGTGSRLTGTKFQYHDDKSAAENGYRYEAWRKANPTAPETYTPTAPTPTVPDPEPVRVEPTPPVREERYRSGADSRKDGLAHMQRTMGRGGYRSRSGPEATLESTEPIKFTEKPTIEEGLAMRQATEVTVQSAVEPTIETDRGNRTRVINDNVDVTDEAQVFRVLNIGGDYLADSVGRLITDGTIKLDDDHDVTARSWRYPESIAEVTSTGEYSYILFGHSDLSSIQRAGQIDAPLRGNTIIVTTYDLQEMVVEAYREKGFEHVVNVDGVEEYLRGVIGLGQPAEADELSGLESAVRFLNLAGTWLDHFPNYRELVNEGLITVVDGSELMEQSWEGPRGSDISDHTSTEEYDGVILNINHEELSVIRAGQIDAPLRANTVIVSTGTLPDSFIEKIRDLGYKHFTSRYDLGSYLRDHIAEFQPSEAAEDAATTLRVLNAATTLRVLNLDGEHLARYVQGLLTDGSIELDDSAIDIFSGVNVREATSTGDYDHVVVGHDDIQGPTRAAQVHESMLERTVIVWGSEMSERVREPYKEDGFEHFMTRDELGDYLRKQIGGTAQEEDAESPFGVPGGYEYLASLMESGDRDVRDISDAMDILNQGLFAKSIEGRSITERTVSYIEEFGRFVAEAEDPTVFQLRLAKLNEEIEDLRNAGLVK